MRRTRRDIAARTVLTGMVGGAITGVLSLLLFLLGAMFTAQEGAIRFSGALGLFGRLVSSSLFAAVMGLVAGGVIAVLALAIMLPVANWAAVLPWRARMIGAVSCSWPLPLPITSLATNEAGPAFWAVAPLVMAVGIGAFRGPDLIIRW